MGNFPWIPPRWQAKDLLNDAVFEEMSASNGKAAGGNGWPGMVPTCGT